MANLLLIADPDPARRRRFAAQAEARLAPLDGLVTGRVGIGDLWVGWAAAPGAPVDVHRAAPGAPGAGDGDLAVLWGRALRAGESRALGAEALFRLWAESESDASDEPAGPEALDGYHAALVRRAGRLVLGGDRLGILPLYYAASGNVLIAGTSARLFSLHPRVPARVDRRALVGIFLGEGLVDDRGLIAGTRRLRAGHLLVRDADGSVRETRQYAMPTPPRDETSPFAAQVERLDRVLGRAVRRQLGDGSWSVLLSGGRDSRLLAGYAARRDGRGSVGGAALTVGRRGDYEVRYARRVAAALGLPLRRHEVRASAFRAAARVHARWELLCSGIGHFQVWDWAEPLGELAPRVVCGYLLDSVVGGTGFIPPEVAAEERDFERFSPVVHQRAFEPSELRRLLRPELSGIVDEVVDGMRRRWEAAVSDRADRLLGYEIAPVERNQVGGMAWRVSFGAWPIVPVLDEAVLEAVASVSVRTVAHRRAQDEILRTRFPRLARIPLVERNDEPVAPPLPSSLDRLLEGLRKRFGPEPGSRLRRRERRTLWRANDFNGPGWRAVRRLAEPDRDALAEWFDMDEVGRILPGPGRDVVSHTFFDTMGRQLLVGLILVRRVGL